MKKLNVQYVMKKFQQKKNQNPDLSLKEIQKFIYHQVIV